ncbi:hypothetical protein K474DRAFT_1657204 [Panus rudis PR-1116 ss-1]|nr:hypothetical protein K474DRAFT_1657204 [Panus rudis PR-1116 ss-1]
MSTDVTIHMRNYFGPASQRDAGSTATSQLCAEPEEMREGEGIKDYPPPRRYAKLRFPRKKNMHNYSHMATRGSFIDHKTLQELDAMRATPCSWWSIINTEIERSETAFFFLAISTPLVIVGCIIGIVNLFELVYQMH